MKKILIAAIMLASFYTVNAQVKFEALQLTPPMPKTGQTVRFKYDARLSPLIGEKKVDVMVYLFSKKGPKVLEPKVLQSGKVYSGQFKVDSNTTCIAFGFSSGEEKDINSGKGYILPVYKDNNVPVQDYYSAANTIQNGYGEFLFGMATDAAKGLACLEDGINQYPELKIDPVFFNVYLRAVNTVKKKEAPALILNELQIFESHGNLTEAGYNTLIQWYTKDKRKEKSDSLTTAMKAAYPDGNWKKNEMASAINKGKDAESKKTAFEAFIKAYPTKEEDKSTINFYRSNVASAYHKEKNYEAFKTWAKDLPMADKAGLFNDLSWYMAMAKENLTEAKMMSYEATDWAKKEMLAPTEKKPESITGKQWDKNRKTQYAMYGDTYAFILYNLEDYKNGFLYAKEAAKINEFKNSEYNERYSQLLEKVTSAALAKKEIEEFVKDGAASSKTKDLLKELYIKEKKSDEGYDAYLTKLEMAAKEKKREELAKTMINEEAPKFNLKDLEGNDISLVGLKGKVVVVDFWATWCGPCIASMPAMKTAQEKLTPKGDVAFVFVDTWENVENKKQNAADFMSKNKYPFHVLLDDTDKVVADFKVSGIPTKFIIDKTGNIRFKSVGFGGNNDALVDEVSMMVEMAAVDMPVRTYVK